MVMRRAWSRGSHRQRDSLGLYRGLHSIKWLQPLKGSHRRRWIVSNAPSSWVGRARGCRKHEGLVPYSYLSPFNRPASIPGRHLAGRRGLCRAVAVTRGLGVSQDHREAGWG
jgi:hypothetical protein